MKVYNIEITWDGEACVWVAVCDDIPLALESNSYDALIERVKIVAPEIIELNYGSNDDIMLCFKSKRMQKVAL